MAKKTFKPSSDLAEITAESRELMAKKIFELEGIRHQITEHAAQGKCRLRICQGDPLTLSDTKAAKHICATLNKKGYSTVWMPTPAKITYSNNNIEMVNYDELVIAWGSQQKEEYREGTDSE